MTSLFFTHALLPDGWAERVRITVLNGLINAVETNVQPGSADQCAGVALPGMPNVHSHAFQRGMAGLSERRLREEDSFWSWREIMYRFLDRMTPDDVEAIAAQAYVEMLCGGFTRVGEFHYVHQSPDGTPYADPAELSVRIASAAYRAGIRLTLLPCFYAHADFGAAPPEPGQRRFVNTLDSYAALLGRLPRLLAALDGATLGLAPHSLRAVSADELAALVALAGDRPIHIHAAEQQREVEASLAWSGRRPIEWLLDHVPIDARWCLIHATHMTSDETARLAATGATVGLCPLTEASLGDGTFPAVAWQAAGGRIAIGTDSNIQIDVAAELRQLEYGQRLFTRRRNVLAAGQGASTGATLFNAALAGGAAVLAAPVPRLAPGAPADIVSLDHDTACFDAANDANRLDAWLFAAARSPVCDVWVAGIHLVADGRHRAADPIRSAYRACVRRLMLA